MREIMFRGKRIDNGKWVQGAFVPGNNVYPATIFYGPRCSIGEYVDPTTVGQYTGLTDKNGKRIFEGDILSLRTGRQHIVKFEDGGFVMTDTAIPIRHADKFEVIGNIHDNPELVKEG